MDKKIQTKWLDKVWTPNRKDENRNHKNNLKTFCICMDFLQETSKNGNFELFGKIKCHIVVLTIRWPGPLGQLVFAFGQENLI